MSLSAVVNDVVAGGGQGVPSTKNVWNWLMHLFAVQKVWEKRPQIQKKLKVRVEIPVRNQTSKIFRFIITGRTQNKIASVKAPNLPQVDCNKLKTEPLE